MGNQTNVLPAVASSMLIYHGKRVVVTGGLGFIGSNLAIRLVELGAKVTIVDASIPCCGANPFNIAAIRSAVRVVSCNVGDVEQLEEELSGTEVIFNVAGEISHSLSMADPERDLRINTVAQLRFLLACRTHCPAARIVYASTRQVYGRPEYLPVDEAHPILPVDFNGVHKYATTQYHLLLSRRGDLDCVVLFLSNVYGPRIALHLPHQGFMSVFLRRASRGEPILVYGDGMQLRDPVYVDDVTEAFLLAGAASPLRSRVYNIGGPHALTLLNIADTMARLSPGSTVSLRPFPEESACFDIGSYNSDNSRALRDFSWKPRITLEEGAERTLAYYREHLHHYAAQTNESVSGRGYAAGGGVDS